MFRRYLSLHNNLNNLYYDLLLSTRLRLCLGYHHYNLIIYVLVWMITCTLFVFGALVEYAALLYIKKSYVQTDAKNGHMPKVKIFIISI